MEPTLSGSGIAARLDAIDRLVAAASPAWSADLFGVKDGRGRMIFSIASTRGDIDLETPNAVFTARARTEAPWLSAALRAALEGGPGPDRAEAARRIEGVREVLDGTAPAPWDANGDSDENGDAVVRDTNGHMVLRVLTSRGDFNAEVSDAQFAASMRTEIPWLADTLERILDAAARAS